MTTTDKLAAALRELHAINHTQGVSDGRMDVASAAAEAALAEYDAERAQVPSGDHAPGPWRIERKERHDGWMQTFIVGADFPDAGIVAEVNMGRSPLPAIERRPGDGEASARRIVACVNACAGIPTKVLEDDPGYIRAVMEGRDQ